MACNVGLVQLLWFPAVRRNVLALFVIALFTNAGMWVERVMIVITGLHHDYMPSRWGMYVPTIWDWATLLGTLGLFAFLFLLFIRLLPMISISEVQKLVTEEGGTGHA
ncbi:hypothetical protein D3C78_1594230 [compost metagenome]